MTEKVTIGYNEYIITTHTHITNKKNMSHMSPKVFFSLVKTTANKSQNSVTHLELSRIFFFAILLLSLRSFFMIEGLNQQVIDCVSRFH